MMNVWKLSILSLILFALPCAAKYDKVRYRCQVFKLSSAFESKTSLEKEIWEKSDKSWDKIKDEVTLFDTGEFRLGKDRLRIERDDCYWNDTMLTFSEGHKAALPEDRISLIYSPNITRKQGELVRLKIESKQPFQFMEQNESGLFELKELHLPVGMDIELRAERDGKDHILVSYMELELRTVNRRAKAQGTHLPVGRPEMDEVEYKLKLRLRERKSYGILLRPKNSKAAIVMRIEVDDR